jgi:hypothetical protein
VPEPRPSLKMVEGPVFAIVTPFTNEGCVDEAGLIRSLTFFASKVKCYFCLLRSSATHTCRRV